VILSSNLSLTTGTLALAAALTGVNSITAAAGTALTLAGGTSGASLVLGNANTGASLGGGGLAVGSSASFVVGATAGVVTNAVGVPQISASSNTYSSIGSIAHNTTDGNHGFVLVGKSRGTKASPTILADGDTFGEYAFVAYDGAAYRTSAGIRGIISGTPGAGDLPTRLSFSVAADGAPSTTERMNLMPTGNLLIGATTDISGSGRLAVAGGEVQLAHTTGAAATAIQFGSTYGSGSLAIRNGATTIGTFSGTTAGLTMNLPIKTIDTTTATSYVTGALQSLGGAGVNGAVWADGTAASTLTGSGLVVRGGNTTFSTNIAEFRIFGGTTATTAIAGDGSIRAFANVAATNTTTGSVVVGGGIGVSGAGYFGGGITSTASGDSSIQLTSTAATPAAQTWQWRIDSATGNMRAYDVTGAFYPLVIKQRSVGNSDIQVASTTASTTTTSGALQVVGGMGVGAASVFSGISNPGTGVRSERFGSGASTSTFVDTVAVGYNATAGAFASTVIGAGATGIGAVSLGYTTNAASQYSVAIGYQAGTSTGGAVAVGSFTTAAGTGIALGYSQAALAGDIVFGIGNVASEVYIGQGKTAAADYGTRIQPASGNGAGVLGGTLRIAGGKGGNAATAGGSVIIQTAAAGTGTTLTDRLTISPTGAATFAGNVNLSAGASLQIGTLTPFAGTTSYATAAMQGTLGALIDFGKSNATARVWRFGLGIDGADEFGVQDLTLGGAMAFKLTAGTRAATFGSTVTAGGLISTSGTFASARAFSATTPSGNGVGVRLLQTSVSDWEMTNTATTGALTFANSTTSYFTLSSTGAATFAGQVTISSAAPYQLLTATTGTNYAYTEYVNTGNNLRIGLENSAGASIVPGAPAYAAFVASVGARSLVFATNNVVRQTIDSAGATTYTSAVTINSGGLYATGAASTFDALAASTDLVLTLRTVTAGSASSRSTITNKAASGLIEFNSDAGSNGIGNGYDFKARGVSRLSIDSVGAATFAGNVNALGFVLNRTNNSGHYTGTSDNYGFTWTGTNGEMSTATGSMIFKPAATTSLTLTSTSATFAGTLATGGAASIGVAVSTGLGFNVNLDPGTLTYGAANAWLGARIRPARAGTTGNAFAVSGQLEITSGTQTSGATFMSEAPSGTITNHTYFYANSSGSRIAPTGNYSFYAESAAGPAYIGSTTPSTGVGFGALQVAGGIYVGAASVFAGDVAFNVGRNTVGDAFYSYSTNVFTFGSGNAAQSARIFSGGNAALTFDTSRGATFAGTVTTLGRILAIGTIRTAAYTVTTSDHVVVCNNATTPFTVTMIAASSNTGRQFIIKNKGVATITVDATSLGTIDGSNTMTLTTNQAATLVSDGVQWNRI
jgi:hypothetical protein